MTFNLHLTAKTINDWSYTSAPYLCPICRLGQIFLHFKTTQVFRPTDIQAEFWSDASGTIASLGDTASGLIYPGIFMRILVTQDLIHFQGQVFSFVLYGHLDNIQLCI